MSPLSRAVFLQCLKSARQIGAVKICSCCDVDTGSRIQRLHTNHALPAALSAHYIGHDSEEPSGEPRRRNEMAAKRLYHARCNVPQCVDDEKSLFALPSTEPLKTQWLSFIYAGNVPNVLPKSIHVCAKHFTDGCFHNLGQYRAGFANVLKIKFGSVPSLASPSDIHSEQVSYFLNLPEIAMPHLA